MKPVFLFKKFSCSKPIKALSLPVKEEKTSNGVKVKNRASQIQEEGPLWGVWEHLPSWTQCPKEVRFDGWLGIMSAGRVLGWWYMVHSSPGDPGQGGRRWSPPMSWLPTNQGAAFPPQLRLILLCFQGFWRRWSAFLLISPLHHGWRIPVTGTLWAGGSVTR